MSTFRQQLHITVWPGASLPVPALQVLDARLLAPESRVVALTRPGGSPETSVRSVALQGWEYLYDLADLNLTSADEIVAFANRWGWIGDPQFRIERPEDADLGGYEEYLGPEPRARFDALSDAGTVQDAIELGVARDLLAANHGRTELPHGELRHLDEFVLYASVLRDLTRIWRGLSEPEAWAAVLTRWETPAAWLEPPAAGLRDEDAREACAAFLCAVLNEALSPFRAHLTLHRGAPAGRGEPGWHANTYQALALQLANDIAEGVPYKVCANRTCGRIFVRQRGTAVHGQYRSSGVLYCSASCAKAQAQRNYRQRQRRDRS